MFGKDYKAEAERLSNELSALSAEKLTLEDKLEQAMEDIQAAAQNHTALKKQVSAHKATIDTLKEAHAKQLENLEGSINRRLNMNLAAIGVSTFAIDTFSVSKDATDMECYQTFQSLQGQERTEYYNKHKEQITRALIA